MNQTNSVRTVRLETKEEVSRAVEERMERKQKAENLFRNTFGNETFEIALVLRSRLERSTPILAFPRCIAKPDIRHSSLYMTASGLGYSLLNLDWYSDKLTKQNEYKRTLVDVPLGRFGSTGVLSVDNLCLTVGELKEVAAEEIQLNIQTITASMRGMQRKNPEFGSSLSAALTSEDLNCSNLIQFHSVLRGLIEGPNQTCFDCSELGRKAASYLIGKQSNMPGIEQTKYTSDKGNITVSSVGGQVLYLVMFGMQAMIPNLIIAETDWDRDCAKIKTMYERTVEFLTRNDLCEPAQVLVPSFHETVAEPINGNVKMKLDYVIPTMLGVTKSAKPQERETITETMVESARSMLELMRSRRRSNGEVINL